MGIYQFAQEKPKVCSLTGLRIVEELNLTQELDVLQGTIQAVVYQNYDNGYSVLRLNVGQGQPVTVVGTIPLPIVGEQLMVTGKWSTHSSYGKQFEAEFLERLMPQSASQIQTYLSGRIIKARPYLGLFPRRRSSLLSRALSVRFR